MDVTRAEVYQFDDFRLDASERLLYRGGELVPLTPKLADTLVVLVRGRGRVVTKDELLREVWPETFVEESSLTQNIWMLRKTLGQTVAGGVFIETVPKRGYRFSPPVADAPPATALETPATLQTQATTLETPEAAPPAIALPPSGSRRVWLAVAVALALAIAVGSAVLRAPPTFSSRRSLAVIGFRNLAGGTDDWRSIALTEMFTTELSAGSGLRTIASDQTARLRSELPLADADSFSKETLARIRQNLGCDLVLAGSYLSLGGKFRVDVRLLDAATGEVSGSFSQTGDEADLLGIVSSAGNRLREALGLGAASTVERNEVRASTPANPEAVRLYAEGLSLLRRFDAPEAQSKLAAAIAADPKYPLAHSALSEAWGLLGYDQRARSEAKMAFDLSSQLTREDRLLVEGHYRQAVADWAQAIDVYRSLWKFYPDNAEYGLLLASAEVSAGQARQALGVIGELRRGHLASSDARLDIAEALAAASLGDFRGGLATARRAAGTARSQGARLLEARANLEMGRDLFHLTDPKQAGEAFGRAQEICSGVGDRGCVAEALNEQGSLLRSQGDLNGAGKEFEQALSIERSNGDQRRTIHSLAGLAAILRNRADMKGAQALFEQALELSQETGDQRSAARSLVNLGNVLNNSGNPEPAKQRYQQGLDLARGIGDRNQMSIAMNNLAVLAYTEGDLAGARKSFEEVLDLKRQIGDRSSYAYTLSHYGTVLEFQGDLAGARRAWTEQCQIQSSTTENVYLANCQLALAEIDLEEGHPEAVEAPARKIIAAFSTVNPSADAWRMLTIAWLKTGDLNKARDAAEHASKLALQTPNVADYKLPIAIAVARVDAAAGRKSDAVRSLADSLKQATALHLAALQLEARLSLCEIQRDPAEIAALRQDAQRLGFGLIASKAAQLGKIP
jgi:DNA-binding winged helix-turn-helix (wHTH) protein/tetratricopeptide (TPR) repeat protein